MKLITFRRSADAAPEPGLLEKDAVYALAPLGYADAESFIAAGHEALHSSRALIGKGNSIAISSVQLLSPLLHPPRIFCVGLNYVDHAAESKMVVQAVPTIFIWGENDVFAAPSHGRELEAMLPDIKFHWVNNAGHQVQTDQPEIVAEIVDQHIAKSR